MLIGFDRGEWGGSLWWFSLTGHHRYRIFDRNVRAVLLHRGSVLALSGLAHLGTDEGTLLELKLHGGQWRIETTTDVGANPEAHTVDRRGRLLIATNEGLMTYSEGRLTTLRSSNYHLLYPSSVAEGSDGRIFVGMRHVVARVSSTVAGYREVWLVPPGNECVARTTN